MSEPRSRLAPELAATLQVLERAFGSLQDLDIQPIPPERQAARRAGAGVGRAAQPGLFDLASQPDPDPCPSNPEVMP